MFEFDNILRLLSILTYIFFIIGGIIGMIDFDKNCYSNLILSIHIFFVGIISFYLEFTHKIKTNKKSIRCISLIWNGILVLAINTVNLSFGIYSIIIGIINGIYYILTSDDIIQELTPINTDNINSV